MATDERPDTAAVVEFLRREAPLELARLRSVAGVAARDASPFLRPDPRNPSYSEWMVDTYALFDARRGLPGAA